VPDMGKKRNTYKVWARKKVKQRDHLEDLGVDGNTIFKENVREWSGLILLSLGTNGRLL